MPFGQGVSRLFLAVLAPVAVAACDSAALSGFAGPTLEITVSTTGPEPDLDGYTVQVDAEPARAIQTATPLRVHNIQPGNHAVFVAGIADNCMADGANPRSVQVEIEGTTTVTIAVVCAARTGEVLVTTRARGRLPYATRPTVLIDGAERANIDTGIVLIRHVVPGPHVFELRGMASHCMAQGNPRTVNIPPVETTAVDFLVTCTGLGGILEIETVAFGAQNPQGYLFSIDGGRAQRLVVSFLAISNIAAGPHTVLLSDIPHRCAVLGQNPHRVLVPPEGRGRARFEIFCEPSLTPSTVSRSPAEP
jgi:hypothetical protein